jgi:hypothetical protein
MAEDTNPVGVGDDPDYRTGGDDTLRYNIPVADLHGRPASVEATLYYQATPPFFLQDRFCTAKGTDRDRLAYIAAGMTFTKLPMANWKLFLVTSGRATVSR